MIQYDKQKIGEYSWQRNVPDAEVKTSCIKENRPAISVPQQIKWLYSRLKRVKAAYIG